jgi:hypothetical protein
MPLLPLKPQAYAAIEERYRCEHEQRELRRRTIADGRPAYYRQCHRCGNAGRAVSVREVRAAFPSVADVPPFDDDLEVMWFAQKRAEYVRTYQEMAPILRQEYETYLATAEWAERREAALARAGHICEVCEHYPATQAHHTTYVRIGCESPGDLLAVCSFCHGLLHSRGAL